MEELSARTDEHEFYLSAPKGYRVGKTKYVVITGSVISGVGKGTFSSCIGTILSLFHGFRVSPIKFDGYLNCDAGTLNPFRHGEVFVLDDGTECDLDLGSYERMLNKNLSKDNYLTSGKIFKMIIDKERAGGYLGRDVQFIPHVTGEIKGFLRNLASKTDADIVLVEVGGTVGDLENSYFIEAMRELSYEEGRENVFFINVTYILEPRSLGEHKSKAAQLGVKSLMSLGVQPNMIICRSENPVNEKVREKISIFSNVPLSRVVNCYDVGNMYSIPLFLMESGVDKEIINSLNLKKWEKIDEINLGKWKQLAKKTENPVNEVTVGITGKYTNVHDSYISIIKALEHSGSYSGTKVNIRWIETTEIENGENDINEVMKGLDGIIIPGGFGKRGIEGKIMCAKYARENNIPYLGLCLGFQIALMEFARNVCGIKDADSTEMNPDTKSPVVDILPEQKKIEGLGGNMRLGGKDVEVKKGTLAHKLYGKDMVRKRFRHRFECNPEYIQTLERNGLVFSGKHPKYPIMQILEIPKHPFFLATQYHAEFTSKTLHPEPLFSGFLKACMKK
ncbi:MAG: CTP synthase (glutamine hydrolyzing) [Candidatus Aenigmarchaeota archaeon]|nr:CTP synthase (glutamine hydrolyzing) [Candidatus Aenigmarchaeota archaeon]